MFLLLLFAVLSIFFSFLCSILEAVLLSVTPTFINLKKKEAKPFALTLEELKKDVDQPLIAILTLNTVAHTVGAIGVGATAEQAFGSGDNVVGIVSAVMTFLILVVSEIIPKTIGATHWKKLAGFTTRSLQLIIWPLKWTGLLWLLRLATRLIGGKNTHGSVFSRDDFSAMADIAHKEGVFLESESIVIKNLLKFDQILAKDVMTPRPVMKIANEKTTIQQFYDNNPKLRFSRIPVYGEEPDNITGVVLKDTILEELINKNGDKPLSSVKRKLLITKRDLPIPKLFEHLVAQKEHISLVVDEFGAVSGLVTMEDVIETLLGFEIMDESDQIADLQQLARQKWESRAKNLGLLEEDNN